MSGCKIRAENRDKLQIIKERPGYGEFDILPVFMFGRIGQIADKTPFTVGGCQERRSTQESEQRFDNHTDKLTDCVRFWREDGKSKKTSILHKAPWDSLWRMEVLRGCRPVWI